MRRELRAAVFAAAVALSGAASAHELTCEKTVEGKSFYAVEDYPFSFRYLLTITNVHPAAASVAQTIEESLFDPLFGQSLFPPAPLSVPVGESVTRGLTLSGDSYQHCWNFAALDGREDEFIDNTLRVTWDLGEVQCSARVECQRPPCVGEFCGTPPTATRTIGFYSTHLQPLEECLAAGAIGLGFVVVDSMADALGLLWGNPARFANGTVRSDLDRARFLLGRQLLAGICNQRLYGTDPDPASLFTNALGAMGTRYCSEIQARQQDVDAYNNSGDNVPFEVGYTPGPATPQDARDLALDPTTPSNLTCLRAG